MLDTLPVELLHDICSKCDGKGVRSLRGVSRLLKDIADEYMIVTSKFNCILRRTDLEMMAEIVERNPHIAKTIFQLHFKADRLLPARNKEHWDDMRKLTILDQATNTYELRPDLLLRWGAERDQELRRRVEVNAGIVNRETARYSDVQIENAYRWYLGVVEDQQDLMSGNGVRDYMCRIFRACKNVGDDLSVTQTSRLFRCNAWERLKSREFPRFKEGMVRPWSSADLEPNTESLTQTLLGAIGANRAIRRLTVAPLSYEFFQQHASIRLQIYNSIRYTGSIDLVLAGMLDVMEDIYISYRLGLDKHIIETLVPQATNHDEAESDEAENDQAESDEAESDEAESDEAESDEAENDDAENDEAEMLRKWNRGGVAMFLAKARNLEVLRLRFPSTNLRGPTRMELTAAIPSDHSWPNLRSIDVSNFQCTDDELLAFIAKCCATVKKFRISGPVLTQGNWTTCFRSMAGEFRDVEELHFGDGVAYRFSVNGEVGAGFGIRIPEWNIDPLIDFLRTGENEPEFVTSGWFDLPEDWDP